MTSATVIANKVSSAGKYLKILEGYKRYSPDDIKNSVDLQGAIERYLYLAIQTTIDLAEAIIAYKDFRKPTTMSESFSILGEEQIIPPDLVLKMVKMTGFRNIIAHDYEKVNYDIVYDILQNRLADIKDFLKIAKALQ